MYYSYVEIEYVATSFSPARTDLALKLLMLSFGQIPFAFLVSIEMKDVSQPFFGAPVLDVSGAKICNLCGHIFL